MHILVINCGSSSIKAAIVDHQSGECVRALFVERVGDAAATLRLDHETRPLGADGADHQQALRVALPLLLEGGVELQGVAHRVVHGGERFTRTTRITDEVEEAVAALIPLAPLHNPANLAGVQVARALLPDLPHFAVFDTAFHATLPRRAQLYALPHDLVERRGVRRYGFHGPSHQYVSERAAEHLHSDPRDLRVITCHLGNGCSICAVEYGRSVETSMGMTPVEGLVMGTRSGDVDAGVLINLMREEGLSVDELDVLLNKKSGLAGLSGVGNDVRDIEAKAAEGDERCRTALQVFTHRVRKYIGAYAAVMGGVDAIVFTAGIGQNSALIRHRIAQRLEFLGAHLDEDRNRDAEVSTDAPVAEISAGHSRCRLLVVATDEQHAIAREAAGLLQRHDAVTSQRTIPVAISARHVHLTQESVEALFGEGHALTERNPLSQPGQFACEETVTVVGPKRSIEKVRVLGPTRSKNQIEISRTDEFFLGIDAPVRGSGDVPNTPGCTLIGTQGRRLDLTHGVICAWRHIHMTPEDAAAFEVEDRDVVEVALDTDGRDLIFGDVLVRVSPKYKLEMHIDTDEGNAAELSRGAEGVLVETSGRVALRRKQPRPKRPIT